MRAELIAIGSELTDGAKLDTNSQWLSLELTAAGIVVDFHSTVADNLDDIIGVFRTAVERSDVVLITGGIGPTLDDLTRQALAGLLETDLALHQPSLDIIQAMFESRNREMPERNRIQAMFPVGSEPIPNPRGTAPGIWAEVSRKTNDGTSMVAAMPGVPSEMKLMFHRDVLPRLSAGGRFIRRARLNCFGLGESNAEEMLGELTARGKNPEVGITAHEATITLRISAYGSSAGECDERIDATKSAIREILGHNIYSEEDDELHDIVVALLAERGLTLASAEAGAGGLLAHRITDVPGFEKCYLGGAIAATHHSSPEGSSQRRTTNTPPSAKFTGEMANGCRQQFDTDFALAISDIPKYDPDNPPSTVPTAYIALAGNDVLDIREHILIGDPAIAKSRAAKAALNLLRLHLTR